MTQKCGQTTPKYRPHRRKKGGGGGFAQGGRADFAPRLARRFGAERVDGEVGRIRAPGE